jgi:hypothetical protein
LVDFVILRVTLCELRGNKSLTTKELKGFHKGFTKFNNNIR